MWAWTCTSMISHRRTWKRCHARHIADSVGRSFSHGLPPHGQHRTITAACPENPTVARFRGLAVLDLPVFGSGGLLTLLPIERWLRSRISLQALPLAPSGLLHVAPGRVLGRRSLPPLQCDIVCFVSTTSVWKGRRLRALTGAGPQWRWLWLIFFHKLMLYQLFWKVPFLLMGAMGWPNIYCHFCHASLRASRIKTKRCRNENDWAQSNICGRKRRLTR